MRPKFKCLDKVIYQGSEYTVWSVTRGHTVRTDLGYIYSLRMYTGGIGAGGRARYFQRDNVPEGRLMAVGVGPEMNEGAAYNYYLRGGACAGSTK